MSPVSKSKTKSKDMTTSGVVKEQLKDSVKLTSFVNGNDDGLASAVPTNGHSHNVDDFDAHSGSSGNGAEYDSVSNNGSCSGESEDPKEKTVGNIVDFGKREKIRLRNEKKHQRQRERRAQELHERCCSFLMSRKLELLSRQIIAMGFTSERATLALMVSGGKLEESVTWLLEGNEESNKKDTNIPNGGSLKIDITEELAGLAAVETKYNCSKKEVQRAVVSSEGDLQKAEEMLRRQKQESLLSSSGSRESANNNTIDSQIPKPESLDSVQQRRSERDLNNPVVAPVGSAYVGPVNKQQQPLRLNHTSGSPRLWKPPASTLPISNAPATSVLLRPSSIIVNAPRSNVGNGSNNVQQALTREPLVMMQRPQSTATKQNLLQATSVSLSGRGAGQYHDSSLSTSGNAHLNLTLSSLGARNGQQQQSSYQTDYKQHHPVSNLSDASAMQLGSFGSRNAMAPSPTSTPLHVPASLGLFSSNGISGNSNATHVDWSAAGQMPLCDYTSIDWTMGSSPLLKPNTEWNSLGLSSIWSNHRTNGVAMSGFSERLMDRRDVLAGSREWSSPFGGGNDILSTPRQFVNSSSLW